MEKKIFGKILINRIIDVMNKGELIK